MLDGLDVAPSGWREARLDMLLAEELAVSPAFADFFARSALEAAGCSPPEGQPLTAEVHFNVWHEVDDGNHGENDLDLLLTWPNAETRRVLIEDKVWAPLQPRQAKRYRARAAACSGAAILVAPRLWMKGHAEAVAVFHASHSIEGIAAWLRASARPHLKDRLGWRANLLDELTIPRQSGTVLDHPPTMEFRDYCIDRLASLGSGAEAAPMSLHTENQGWLWFRHPRDLVFKARSGSVDLYVQASGFSGTADELRVCLADLPPPSGFKVANDTSKKRNVVLRYVTRPFSTSAGVPNSTSELDAAIGACHRITEWFNHGGARIIGTKGASL